MREPEQDGIYDYSIIHKKKEYTLRFSNPLLEDEILLETDLTMTVSDIIAGSYKRKNIVTGEEEIFA